MIIHLLNYTNLTEYNRTYIFNSLIYGQTDVFNLFTRKASCLLSGIGMITNLIIFITLLIYRRHCTTYFLLLTMAINDCIYCSMYLTSYLSVNNILNIINRFILCQLSFFLQSFSFMCSSLILFVCLMHTYKKYDRSYNTATGQLCGRLSLLFIFGIVFARAFLDMISVDTEIDRRTNRNICKVFNLENITSLAKMTQYILQIIYETVDTLIYLACFIVTLLILYKKSFCCKSNNNSQMMIYRSHPHISCSNSVSNIIQSPSSSQRKPSVESLLLKNHYRTHVSTYQICLPSTTVPIANNDLIPDKHHRLDLVIFSLGVQTSLLFFPVIFLKLDANFSILSLQAYLLRHSFWYSIAHPSVLLSLATRIFAYCLFDMNFRHYFNKIVAFRATFSVNMATVNLPLADPNLQPVISNILHNNYENMQIKNRTTKRVRNEYDEEDNDGVIVDDDPTNPFILVKNKNNQQKQQLTTSKTILDSQQQIKPIVTNLAERYACSFRYPAIKLKLLDATIAIFETHVKNFLNELENKTKNIHIAFWHIDKNILSLFVDTRQSFAYLLQKQSYPDLFNGQNFEIIPPLRIPPQMSLLITGVPTHLTKDDILDDARIHYPSISDALIQLPSQGARACNVRLDFTNSDEYEKCHILGKIGINHMDLKVKQYLAKPKVLFCNKCHECSIDITSNNNHACNGPKCKNCGHDHYYYDNRCPVLIEYNRTLLSTLIAKNMINNQFHIPRKFRERTELLFRNSNNINRNHTTVSYASIVKTKNTPQQIKNTNDDNNNQIDNDKNRINEISSISNNFTQQLLTIQNEHIKQMLELHERMNRIHEYGQCTQIHLNSLTQLLESVIVPAVSHIAHGFTSFVTALNTQDYTELNKQLETINLIPKTMSDGLLSTRIVMAQASSLVLNCIANAMNTKISSSVSSLNVNNTSPHSSGKTASSPPNNSASLSISLT
ncbi:unnamed protein product [Didymodactylos carnosus]|uniref:Uncharacterized protein n=1 Tax=Didymodactylos carnosus TaxID=1234261 RepID=A0A8S2RHY9_9BILA|nr:unnamed protein product [Didymodactylos carnosus]CAF4152304.1 unnamed protein product [Didymodactylos carnosus]